MCHKIIEIFTKSQGVLKVNKLGQIGSADKSLKPQVNVNIWGEIGTGCVSLYWTWLDLSTCWQLGGGYLISAFD